MLHYVFTTVTKKIKKSITRERNLTLNLSNYGVVVSSSHFDGELLSHLCFDGLCAAKRAGERKERPAKLAHGSKSVA